MTQENTVQATENEPDLKLSDLQDYLQCIDLASVNGGFRGPELSSVGQVRDRLAAIITAKLPPAEGEPVPEADPALDLKLSDLQNYLQIIDTVSGRGAYRGPNLSPVGQVRDRLAGIIAAKLPPAEEAAPAPAEEAAPAEKAAKKPRAKKAK